VDEGKQFNVKSFNVLGLPASIEEELLKDYPIGQNLQFKNFRALPNKALFVVRLLA